VKSGQNLQDMIKMLLKIFTIDNQVIQVALSEFKFHCVENYVKKAGEDLVHQ
jgi:hypothetical protein